MAEDSIGKYLSIARRAHASLLDKELRPYNLNHGQAVLLLVLYKKEGVYQQTLCELYNLNKAAVGRSIKKLEEKGFISKRTDPDDKRKKLIYLTEQAKGFEEKLVEILEAIETKMKANLTEEEIETFFTVIKKICSNLGVELED